MPAETAENLKVEANRLEEGHLNPEPSRPYLEQSRMSKFSTGGFESKRQRNLSHEQWLAVKRLEYEEEMRKRAKK